MSKHLIALISAITLANGQAQEQQIEKLEVTGSYIKRIDIEGPSPVSMIDQDAMTNTGSINISDVLKQSTEFEAVYEGVGHVRFRGQHAGNVLILLNGMRLPKLDGGYYTSISSLPTSVIERVEMLKDGGSALYGSDAMSGVMNFKTKKNLHGGEVSVSTTQPENGHGSQMSYVGSYGKSFSRGNIMGVVQYETSNSYNEKDIGSYNKALLRGEVSEETRSYGRLNGADFGPDCNGTPCETDPLNFYQVRPESKDLTTLLSGRYDFQDVKLSVLGMYNRRERSTMRRTQSVNWSGAEVNNDTVRGTFLDELGLHRTEDLIESYNLQTSLDGYMGDTWTWQVQAGYSLLNSDSQVVSGEADVARLQELYRNNVFNPGGVSGDLSSALIKPTYRNSGDMMTAKAVFAGELFSLGDWYEGGGLVSMAVGAEAQFEGFEFKHDKALTDGTTIARPSENFKGDRDVYSAFMEFSAFPVESVELQLAHRFDHYSDVGNTYNPKASIAYKATNALMLRGSVGTGFRAPGLTDVYSTEQTSNQFFTDQNCTNNCNGGNYDVTTYSNSNIKPEESLNYSLGTIYQLSKSVSFTIDQWNFEGKNSLSAIRAEEFTDLERRFGESYLNSIGVEIERDGNGDLVSMKIPRVSNMGERTLRGVDFGAEGNFGVNFLTNFNLGLTNSFSYIFQRETKKFSFDEPEKADKTWKNNFAISASKNKHFLRLAALTVSPSEIGSGTNKLRLTSYTEFDFTYSYTSSWGGKFNFTVKNLSNTRPPVRTNEDFVRYAGTDRQYSSFSPLRRRFFVGYSQRF